MSPLSNTENEVLMAYARESLQGRWLLAAGTTFVFFITIYLIPTILQESIPFAGMIASIIITGPMTIGLTFFMLSISRKQEVKLLQIFDGFQKFGVGVGAYVLMGLFTLLWTLLLIVPGIIAAVSYSLTYFIIVDDGSIGPLQAITKSKEMMQGNKWKLSCMYFWFFLWGLLCVLTLGIGFFWLVPYVMVSMAKFYDEIKIQQDGGFIVPQATPTAGGSAH
jgi:uncharacterized membrane protein